MNAFPTSLAPIGRLGIASALCLLIGCAPTPETSPDASPQPSSFRDDAPPAWVPPMLPKRRYGAGAHRIGDSYFVFGGKTGGRSEEGRDVLRIDKGETAWRKVKPLLDRHDFRGSVVIDGAIYTMGPAILRYQPGTDRWIALKVNQPIPRSHFFAAAVGREIFVIGGYPRERGRTLVFNLDDDTLREGPALPGFRHGDHFTILANLDGTLHAVGGLGNGEREPEKQHFRLVDGKWETRAPHPTGLTGKFTGWIEHEGRLYTFEREGHVYDPKTDTWTALAQPPNPRVLPALLPCGDSFVMLGGLEPENQGNEGWRYFLKEDRWESLKSEPKEAEEKEK